MSIKTYSELILLPTFKERFEYLQLHGKVGDQTFGFDRYLNQIFYKSDRWRDIREYIIIRDNGCDLGVEGYDIHDRIYIHHMNPLLINDIIDETEYLSDPEYLITTRFPTHQAIHYGNVDFLLLEPIERTKYDTCPWRR